MIRLQRWIDRLARRRWLRILVIVVLAVLLVLLVFHALDDAAALTANVTCLFVPLVVAIVRLLQRRPELRLSVVRRGRSPPTHPRTAPRVRLQAPVVLPLRL